ncbi:DUF2304 domain-containing protein [Georgenia ruanii]|uniref:DUF2304 family protein n=1 Tax=Georgenia ruanii TaxID=348442 RepID=A0A7J9USQ5_9MICO|nr:DUF2304 domain-containing protein [Georgenia ruanii]MPV87618.1 DUF2304 family protein [Georgenia ruanii]
MWIQVLLLLGIAATVLPLTRSAAGARHQAIRRLMLFGFVVLAAFAVLFPSWFSKVANLLGVGRGTDLLLYLLVIAFLTYVSSNYRRLAAQDRRITILTRKLALAEGQTGLAATPQETASQPGLEQVMPSEEPEAAPTDGATKGGDLTS